MKQKTISPGEAWEAVERLKLDVSHNDVKGEWCAVKCDSRKFELGWGATPLDAIAQLLERIGEKSSKVLLAELQETNAEIQRLVQEAAAEVASA